MIPENSRSVLSNTCVLSIGLPSVLWFSLQTDFLVSVSMNVFCVALILFMSSEPMSYLTTKNPSPRQYKAHEVSYSVTYEWIIHKRANCRSACTHSPTTPSQKKFTLVFFLLRFLRPSVRYFIACMHCEVSKLIDSFPYGIVTGWDWWGYLVA